MTQDTLHLLLSHDDDGSPVLEDGLPDSATNEFEKEILKTQGHSKWEEGGDPDDLEDQRWGVFAPEGPEGDRLLALIRPLMEARREAQGGHEIKVYRVPSGLTPVEAALWRKTHFDPGVESSTDTPRYQVILGDMDRVSLGVQQIQSSDGYVGRLCFRDDRGYEAYVEKVLRWEKARVAAEASAKIFTVHDGTAATTIGYQALVKPGLGALRKEGYDAADLGARDIPSPSEFLSIVNSPEPTILFSVSHGAGAPRGGWKSYEEQRDRQGAMSFGREGKITGGDIKEDPFLPGGVWFMLACYSAGTPNDSGAYWHWLEKLKAAGQFSGQAQSVLTSLPKEDQAPFVAALPQAVLANPNGPLAIMGHMDLAWTYSFEERDTGKAVSRPAKFMEIVRSALRGYRIGSSFRELMRSLSPINVQLTSLHDAAVKRGRSEPGEEATLRHLWMLRQDISGYILLGDPATRLPALPKKKAKRTEGAPSPEVKRPAERAPSIETKMPARDVLERAIGAMLAGRGLKEAAAEHEIDPAKLQELFEVYRAAGRAALDDKA
jgi:hypothetical protein